MSYAVYILHSKKLNKYYVGQTSDLEKRIERHNQGRERFTRTGTPWTLIHQIPCNTRGEAMKLEKKIKNLGSRRYLDALG